MWNKGEREKRENVLYDAHATLASGFAAFSSSQDQTFSSDFIWKASMTSFLPTDSPTA